MRRKLILAFALVVWGLMTSSSPLPGQQLLKFGLLAPLTGPNAVYGGPILQGAKAAVATANIQGGVGGQKIELVTYDARCEIPQISSLSKFLSARGPRGDSWNSKRSNVNYNLEHLIHRTHAQRYCRVMV